MKNHSGQINIFVNRVSTIAEERNQVDMIHSDSSLGKFDPIQQGISLENKFQVGCV